MPATTERQLARLRARFDQHAQGLGQIGFLLKGSVLQTYRRCGSAGCGCQSDPSRMHGPYWQWTHKVKGKTVTRALTEEQVSRYRQWMENAKEFEETVRDLYEISAQANELLRTQERQPPQPKESPTRRGSRSRS